MYWWWSNQSNVRDRNGCTIAKRFPWHGRAHFYRDDQLDPHEGSLEIEWVIGPSWPSFRFVSGHLRDEPIGFHFSLPLLSLYLNFDGKACRKLRDKLTPYYDRDENRPKGWDIYDSQKELRIACHHGAIYWNIWTPTDKWTYGTPKHRSGCYGLDDIKNLALGEVKITREIIEEREITIPMPEGNYYAVAKVERCIRKRRRWRSQIYYSVIIGDIKDVNGEETGLPHPGKGTTSYNCGDDAIFGSTIPGSSIGEAIGKIIASCLHYRERYPL